MKTLSNERGGNAAALSFSAGREAAAVAGLAALVLIFFWPAVSGRAWVPRGGGDLVSFLWPTYAYAARTLRGGHIPLWNPHLYSGVPFAADNQTGLFYPINLVAFFLLPMASYRSMEWLVFFHFWLAGAGMYVALRLEHLVRPAALAGAIAFMFSDVFITHIGNLNIVAVSAWLPLVFAGLRRGLRQQSAGWCAGAGAALGVAALAGHGQMTLVVGCGTGLYGLWEVLWPGGESEAARRRLRLVGLLALWAAVAVGVSAIATLPAVELTGQTARARLDYAEASRYSLPPAGLAGLFSPQVFGRGPGGFWGPWERVETGYAGAITLLLAAAAFLVRPDSEDARRRWRSLRAFLVLLTGVGLLIALGNYTPIHYWLYRLVPGFAQLRVPARFILLTDFGLCYLAGLGLHASLTRGVEARRVRLAALLLILIGVGVAVLGYVVVASGAPGADTPEHRLGLIRGVVLYTAAIAAGALLIERLGNRRGVQVPFLGLAPRPTLAFVVAGLVAVDVMSAGAGSEIEPNDPTLGYQHPSAIEFLQAQPGPTRMDAASSQWQPDAALMFGLEDIGGISNPLALARYDAYYWSVGYRGSPQYNFLGAQFVVAEKGTPPADATFVPVYDGDPAVDVYLNTGARPRVSLVYQAQTASDGPTAFDLIHAPDFNPAQSVVVEGGPTLSRQEPTGEANLSYAEYGVEKIVVQATTPAPAYLVLAEVWYPGWRAQVDGRDVPIYRANYAFRAVYLEPGTHTVSLTFDPWTWKAGAALTLVTLAALAAWAVRQWRVANGDWRSVIGNDD